MTIHIRRRECIVTLGSAAAAWPLAKHAFTLGTAAFTFAPAPIAKAVEGAERHGISAFGDLKYPADFKQFDYVNPNAPKGGVFSHVAPTRIFNQNLLTFNSLNSYILKGDAAQGMELTFASLMARAYDEPDAMYGLAARAVQISPDRLIYRFLMRRDIRFHDGSPLTAHDVAFSLQVLKEKGHPIIQQLLHNLAGVQAPDDANVVVSFAAGTRATCRCSSPGCRFSRVPIMPGIPSRRPRWSRRLAAVRTGSDDLSRAATSNTSGSRTGGAPICRSRAGRTISMSSATNITAIAISLSRDLPARAICFARNWSHASGRHATTFRRSTRGTSSATSSPTIPRLQRKAGTSTHDKRNSGTSACARPSLTRSISNGSTQQ